MADGWDCEQCGTVFEPRREHERFCSARCRIAWNRENTSGQHNGDTPLGWSVTAPSRRGAISQGGDVRRLLTHCDNYRLPGMLHWRADHADGRPQPGSAMTGFSRAPILSISTRTVSPVFRYMPGRCQAMPLGVPVESTSPTSRVNALDRYDTCS